MNYVPRYTPFLNDNGKFTVGLKQINKDSWLDVDGEYPFDIKQKKVQTDEFLDDVFVQLPESAPAQKEVWKLVDELLRNKNGSSDCIASRDAPLLLSASLSVQEDLCIMTRKSSGWILSAGSINFPSFWSPKIKLGKTVDAIHSPVPRWTKRIGEVITKKMDDLPVGVPFERFNWTLTTDRNKFQPFDVRPKKAFIDSSDIRDIFLLRVERQILYKLQESKDILFTIRTYMTPIGFVEENKSYRNGLRDAILFTDVDTLVYRGINLNYIEYILEYLK
jgi:hypothetical protein